MEEIHRLLNEHALQAAKTFKSAETPFLHGFYGKTEAPHQAIPFYENLLYVLGLFRTRTAENILEAKLILEKLLSYQNEEGLFPQYLHDFPFSQDRYMGAHLLPVLAFIYEYFHTVLGSKLCARMKEAVIQLNQSMAEIIEAMPLHLQIKWGGALYRLGCDLNEKAWQEKGSSLLSHWKQLLESPARFIPQQLADASLGLMLAKHEELSWLLDWMSSLWNTELKTYVGPFYSMQFTYGQQETTLFDFWMIGLQGSAFKQMTPFCLADLQAVLVFPFESKVALHSNVFTSFIKDSEKIRGLYPFVYHWKPHHLLFLNTTGSLIQAEVFKNGCHLSLAYSEMPNCDDREAAKEIVFFLPESLKIFVNGIPASTFRLNDQVTLEDAVTRIKLCFRADAGRYQGHVALGSAPTEFFNFGKNRFTAYHRMLSLRTIDRPENGKMLIDFEYETF